MAVVYAVSEFTDEKGTDWKVKIVDGTISTGDLNHPFDLGPGGFRLSYQFDNFDRAKPILGSRVQFTLFHQDDNDAAFTNLYNNFDTSSEGTYRLEIYRDPDGANEVWWVGTILPEQVVVPDEYPYAAVEITAADGLGLLRGIDYNNNGAAYTGEDTITQHLYKALSHVHSSNFWGASDTFIKFFEDFIGEEYKDHIGVGQNQQLNNAKVQHSSFYNKDSNGIKQWFSAYTVLESIALTFNSCIFMAQGTYWLMPLGNVQGHASNDLDIAHFISGNGTVTYNTSTNVTFDVPFGTNNNNYEKLKGWERTSVPSFKEVKRQRDYQGAKALILDSHYTQANIVAGAVLSDEDISYGQNSQLVIGGNGWYEYDGDNTSSGQNRVGRVKLKLKIRIGDGGGTEKYLKRGASFPGTFTEHQYFYDYDGSYGSDGGTYDDPAYEVAAWDSSVSTYDILFKDGIDKVFDKLHGGTIWMSFVVITPPLPADAVGLQISATIAGVDYAGNDDSDVVDTADSRYDIYDFQAQTYDNDVPQTVMFADISAKNDDDARYFLDQGKTLLGDKVSDADHGTITVYDGSDYVHPEQWTSLHNSTVNLGINRLGVIERMGANKSAQRVERGTLYRTGSLYIHPYTVLENDSKYYQITGLSFIAASCEYDIEGMFLSRDITGITSAQDDTKGPPIGSGDNGIIGIHGFSADSEPTGSTGGGVKPAEIFTKLNFMTTDANGITAFKYSNGAGSDYAILAPGLPLVDYSLSITRTSGGFDHLPPGTSSQVLGINSLSGRPDWVGSENGWFNSTTLMKVMPTEFMGNSTVKFIVIDDGTTDEVSVKCSDGRTTFDVYAIKAIPTGYKATHVQVYGNNVTTTSNCVTVRNYDHTDGDLTNTTSGNMNTNIDILDITSSATQNILIKVTLTSTHGVGQDNLYGADITIAAV